jgi:hypothetical protein
MDNLLSNEYVSTGLKVLLALYASQIAPNSPYLTNIFKNTFVKMALIFLMIYMVKQDFQFSLIFAIILVLGVNAVSGRQLLESYTNLDTVGDYSKEYKKYGNFTLIDPKNEIHPGCVNIKLSDLVAMFDDSHYKLQTAVQSAFHQFLNTDFYAKMHPNQRLRHAALAAGLPYNLEINDENAPWIATLLINYGFIVSSTCQPPN